MLAVLHPTYTLRVTVKDRMRVADANSAQGLASLGKPQNPHRFFNGLTGKTGCDEVLVAVKEALQSKGIVCEIMFERFEHQS